MSFEGMIDLDAFIGVPSPEERMAACRLSLSRTGRLSQNSAFHKKLEGKRNFRLRISQDGHMLARRLTARDILEETRSWPGWANMGRCSAVERLRDALLKYAAI